MNTLTPEDRGLSGATIHRALTTHPVRRALTATIGALIIALTLTVAPLGQAQASPTKVAPVQCPSACPHVYEPVTCKMSNGTVRTFSNRCFAGIYACQHRLTIISCRAD